MFALKTILLATFLATALASEVSFDLKVVTPEQHAANKLLRMSQGWNVTYNRLADPGDSTYGDLVTGPRSDSDILLARETLLVDQVSPVQQILEYTAIVPSPNTVSTVRILNFGLDRAFTDTLSISSDRSTVVVSIIIDANLDPRILTEIYGS